VGFWNCEDYNLESVECCTDYAANWNSLLFHIPVPSGVLPYVRFSFDFASLCLSLVLFSSFPTSFAALIETALRGISGLFGSRSRNSETSELCLSGESMMQAEVGLILANKGSYCLQGSRIHDIRETYF